MVLTLGNAKYLLQVNKGLPRGLLRFGFRTAVFMIFRKFDDIRIRFRRQRRTKNSFKISRSDFVDRWMVLRGEVLWPLGYSVWSSKWVHRSLVCQMNTVNATTDRVLVRRVTGVQWNDLDRFGCFLVWCCCPDMTASSSGKIFRSGQRRFGSHQVLAVQDDPHLLLLAVLVLVRVDNRVDVSGYLLLLLRFRLGLRLLRWLLLLLVLMCRLR